MSQRIAHVLFLSALLAGCGGNPFGDGNLGGDGGDGDGGSIDGGGGGGTPTEPETDFSTVNKENRGFTFDGSVLRIDMAGVSSSGQYGTFARAQAMDIVGEGTVGNPDYLAYVYQETALTRAYLAYVARNARGNLLAVSASDGGQFNEHNAGGRWLRLTTYTRPTVATSPSDPTVPDNIEQGTFSYVGSYAGIFVPGPDAQPNSLPAGFQPGLPWHIEGTIQINAQFSTTSGGVLVEPEVIEGQVGNRILLDHTGAQIAAISIDGTIIGDDEPLLQDIVLRETAIDSNGEFLGDVEFLGAPGAGIGEFAGAFGGIGATDVAGVMWLHPILGQNGIWEYGTFNLPRCDFGRVFSAVYPALTGAGLRPSSRAAVLALLLGLTATAPQSRAEVLELSPTEALLTAQAAYAAGNAPVANRIARALLLVDPNDAYALLIIAATETRLGRPGDGVKAGRQAWVVARKADMPDGFRWEVARNTALAAYEAGRPGLAQYWLRRSLDVAPDDQAKEKSGSDLAYVRANNPLHWSFQLRTGQSDNLNGGATDPIFRVDEQIIGFLGAGAEAVSGSRVSWGAQALYALKPGKTGQTVLGFALEGTVNHIDAASRARAGALRSGDLDTTTASFTLRRDISKGLAGQPVSLSLELAQVWAGGDAIGPKVSGTAALPVWRGDGGSLWLSGMAGRSWQEGAPSAIDSFGLTAFGEAALGKADARMTYALSARALRAEAANSTYDAFSLDLGYEPGWKLGPAEVSFSMSAGYRRYDEFSLGFASVTNGRTDTTLGLGVDLMLPDWDLMGFAPVVSLRHGRTHSNVSRYETETTAVTLGIAQVF